MRFLICALLISVVAGYTSKSNQVLQQSISHENVPEPVQEPILVRIRNNTSSNDLTKTETPVISEQTENVAAATTFTPASSNLNIPTSSAEPQPAAVTDHNKPELETEKPLLITKPMKEEIPSQGNQPQTPEESYIEPSPPILMPTEDYSKRRVITYDQRQEGQYNIRADLENFMIVLIPPSPADGLNLLEVLTKSSSLRPSKNKRKQYASSSSGHGHNNMKYRQNLKSANTNFNLNYLPRAHATPHQPPVTLVESVAVQRLPTEFIEGRTPYHVDISANDEEQSRLHPDRQVDVLPPPYPLAYQHLIKPYHLEAEPTVIQTLPPAEIVQSPPHVSNSFLETYNQLLASSLNAHSNNVNNEAVLGDNTVNNPSYYRMSRNIRTDNYIDTNKLVASPVNDMQRRIQVPLYRAEMTYGASRLYPPIDVPHLMGYVNIENKRSFDKMARSDIAVEQDLNEVVLVPSTADALEAEASNIDAGLNDMSGGTLMERCAPGRRRDSYGICREIAGY